MMDASEDRLPPQPDFDALEAAAHRSADRRTTILAMIGSLVYSWSNNESLFIYVLMSLLRTDQTSAAIVFATLNTTRARLDLIERLAQARLADRALRAELVDVIARFNTCTRARNEFNHCMYSLDDEGAITHTQSMKVIEVRGKLKWGSRRPMDDARLAELDRIILDLKTLNRDLWKLLPRLQAAMSGAAVATDVGSAK